MSANMGSVLIRETPYGAAMKGDWKTMIAYYKEHLEKISYPVTPFRDTALHLAMHSNKEQPLKDLLEIAKESESSLTETEFLKKQNIFGNTVLHEATIYRNFDAIRLLVERCPDLLKETNGYGETPLFTAAGFAETEIVEFFIGSKPEQCVDDNGRLLSIHRQRREDELSILSAAIMGQNFETALLLLEQDDSLASLKNKNGITTLQLLAEMPTAFESGFSMGICERLVYCCLPDIRHNKVKKSQAETCCEEKTRVGDLESGLGRKSGDLGSGTERNQRGGLLNYLKVPKASKMISNLSSSRFLARGCWLEGFWNQKRKHVFALRFAKILIEKDESLTEEAEEHEVKQTVPLSSQIMPGYQNKEEEEQGMGGKKNKKGENEFFAGGKTSEITSEVKEIEEDQHPKAEEDQHPKAEEDQHPKAQTYVPLSSLTKKKEIPLFTATRRGIEKIVRLIISRHPHAIDQRNDKGRSILDVAVMYRQKEIFSLVTQQKIPLARLRRIIDDKGSTLLHHVAAMKKNSGVTKPGPALQLQEELQWFEQVQEVIPSHYVTLLNEEGKTARECFEEKHKKQLEKAQKWIKETSQSCSTVAALVPTVVFAAAYTAPGGSDDNGKPNFINSPYFLIFTVSDVVSLASSLTSLVVFLSLLTSPFELQDFHISLPRKLIVGFTFLFFSVITTMLSFGATILILIQSERKLTTLLLSIAAFLPVFVFAIMQFRLYVLFMGSTFNILKITGKSLSSFLVPCLPWGKKLCRVD